MGKIFSCIRSGHSGFEELEGCPLSLAKMLSGAMPLKTSDIQEDETHALTSRSGCNNVPSG
jgi:hypothetical protein